MRIAIVFAFFPDDMDIALSAFFFPAYPFVIFPPLAFAIALIFWIGYKKYHEDGILTGVIGWSFFGLYESYMKLALESSASAQIRIDLLIIVPAMYVVSAFGIWPVLKHLHKTR